MAYGPVNVPGASEAEVAAVEQAANDAKNVAQGVSDKVGATGDTGGSATAGTVMGKLNKLISDLATHMGRWTAARAGYIDTINTNAKNSADRIGTTGDTGGSTAAGTVMGKLNKLISDIATHAASWTSTRAGYIDTIKGTTDAIKTSADKIGAANDTGGSTTAGSVMGKLNKLISDITTHMGRWTAARAGYIDVINTNAEAAKTDAAAAKTNTAVNNTGSSTGTLSQKLSYIIKQLTDGTAKMGAVKSVQRGTASLSITGTKTSYNKTEWSECEVTVQISSVNPEKCMIILDGDAAVIANGNYLLEEQSATAKICSAPYVHSFNGSELIIKESNKPEIQSYPSGVLENIGDTYTVTSCCKISWQVIEFY